MISLSIWCDFTIVVDNDGLSNRCYKNPRLHYLTCSLGCSHWTLTLSSSSSYDILLGHYY